MNHGEPDSTQVMAADKILDRGCGKASQALTGPGGEGPIIVELVNFVRLTKKESEE